VIFSAITSVMAQNLVIDGRLTDIDSKKRIGDVTVTVYDGAKQIFQTTSATNGKYAINIPVDKNLKIQYSKNGFVTKTMMVNTNGINEEDIPIGGKVFPPIDIDLFMNRPNVDFSFLNSEPVVEWKYDSNSHSMGYDDGKMQAMKSKIENLLEKADNEGKENEAKYNQLIADADKLFIAQDLENALNKYSAAISVPGKAAEAHPNNRIVEIDNLLKLKAKEDMIKQQANQAYQNVVDAADKFYDSKEYDKAVAKYKEAQSMNPSEQYPKDRLADIEAIKKAAASKAEYDELIKSADMFFKQNSLKAAEDKYTKASKLDPSQEYPKTQLDKIATKLKEQEDVLANKKKYDDAIIAADAFFKSEKYSEAKQKYEEAITFESAATYPVERAKMCAEKLKEQQEALELQKKYDEFIKAGDAAMKSSNYDDAISAFTEAIGIKKEAYPEQQLKLAQDKLAALADSAAKKAKIDELFVSADSKMAAENFTGAIEDYKAILALESTNTKAITQKGEAEAALKAQKDNESKLAQFSELKSQGDDFYTNEKWTEALGKYEAAKKLISDDTHVNDRITESKNKLDQLAKNTEKQKLIKKLMDEGAVAEGKSDWSLAIKKYEEVLKNDDNNSEAIQKLESAKKSMDDSKNAAEELAKFNKLKTEGDTYFAQKKWEEAKSKYLEAKDIKADDKIEVNLNLIDQELSKLASSKEKEEKFKDLVEKAKKEEAAKELQKALDLYTEALNYKEGDATTINKINSLKNEIAQLAKNAEKEKLYSEAMERGKKALAEKDYAQAIDGFDDAMLHKPVDPEAIKLKAEANKALSELSKNEASFQKLLSEGKKLKDAGDLNAAKDVYVQAQQMRPADPVPQNAIIEINDLLRKKLEEEESNAGQLALNKKYEEKLDLAVISAQNFDYENAIKHLKEASKIKPEEALPKQKITEYQALMDQINASKTQESKYKDAIRKADLAYDAKKYEESIELYREAIGFQDTKYPKDQIVKAELAIKNRGSEALNREYQNSIKKANDFFSSERYENALTEYNNALTILPGDKYAQDRRDETQQILNNLTLKSQKEKEDKIIFDQLISEADGLFNEKNYIDAKNKYEEALTYFSSNPYAIKRVDECIRLSKEKGKELEESAYRKVVDKADEYFNAENYDRAKKLYERAISLRAYDVYPKSQLDEIKRILNGPVKEETSLQYLGEEVNMSILDGEALFAKSEKQREQDKKQGILRRIFANEKSFEEKSSTDWSERNEYQNEIIYLRDRRAALNVENNADKQVLAINLDDEQFNLRKQRLQENNFERSAILRQNDEIIFILEDFNTLHGENKDKHLVNADKLDLIVLDKAELDRSMTALEEVNRRNTNKELIVIADDLRDDGQRAIDMKKVNDNVVRNLDVNLSSKSEYETAKNYEKLQVLKSDATIAEINRYNSSVEKSLIQLELEDDIAILVGLQSEKAYREARELQNSALEMDAIVLAANEKYKASFADNDLARKETIEDIKVIQAGDSERKVEANNKKYSELQANTTEIETVKKLNEAKVVTMDDDLLAIREEIVSQEKMITRTYAEKNSSEILKREANVDAIDNVVMNTNKVHSEQSKKPGENSEQVKNIESTLNVGEQARKDDFTNRKYETTKLLDDMASNKIQFSEAIANTLGDEFPEGVSQQTYLAKDKDGYPQKVTTRRIVVADGRGEVYLRIQTRNAVTYSKNGQPITEASWLKGTESANLVRHF
jgi:epidermal growth factor receptor substrate 15